MHPEKDWYQTVSTLDKVKDSKDPAKAIQDNFPKVSDPLAHILGGVLGANPHPSTASELHDQIKAVPSFYK